jgi:hypothetical protein
MTVAPVVVNPESDSNIESVYERSTEGENIKGKLPAVPRTTQKRVTIKNPSRVFSSAFDRSAINHMAKPALKIMLMLFTNGIIIPSS